ncbi:MAG: hypothetical protein ACFFKA_11280, partial [Candidatus Thorarchaeota archaeon]
MVNSSNKLHEYCGVFGIVSKEVNYSVAGLIYSGLMAIQHRGQLFTGISVTSCDSAIDILKGKGLVSKVLQPKILRSFIGNVGIGHVCYGYPYCTNEEKAQPYLFKSKNFEFSIALNGRIINPKQIQSHLEKRGRVLTDLSDIELLASLISTFYELRNNLVDAIKEMMKDYNYLYSSMIKDQYFLGK